MYLQLVHKFRNDHASVCHAALGRTNFVAFEESRLLMGMYCYISKQPAECVSSILLWKWFVWRRYQDLNQREDEGSASTRQGGCLGKCQSSQTRSILPPGSRTKDDKNVSHHCSGVVEKDDWSAYLGVEAAAVLTG